MRTLFIVLLAAFALSAVAPAAHAEEYSSTYLGASPGVVGLTSTATTLVIPGSQFGGARFTQDGSLPLRATATDLTGSSIFVRVCQDTDADARCGEAAGPLQPAAEPSKNGCGAVDLADAIPAFAPTVDTLVFIYSTDLPGTACKGTATTGSITLFTAK